MLHRHKVEAFGMVVAVAVVLVGIPNYKTSSSGKNKAGTLFSNLTLFTQLVHMFYLFKIVHSFVKCDLIHRKFS